MSSNVEKPKVGVFKLSSCAGCQMVLIYHHDFLPEILGAVDIKNFKMARRDNDPEAKFDLVLFEGAVTEPEHVKLLKEIRPRTKLLVAMGACACDGGVVTLKNTVPECQVESAVYTDTSKFTSMKAQPIDEFVRVDAYARGCPVDGGELLELLKSALIGRKPNLTNYSVCMECKMNENPCRFINNKEPCMGTITRGGCGSLCPSNDRPCRGCRGPTTDANIISYARLALDRDLPGHDELIKKRELAEFTPSSVFPQGRNVIKAAEVAIQSAQPSSKKGGSSQ
ncbi:MAG: oxidoreductase [Candidatus Atabeyarchaeum deiterrae]